MTSATAARPVQAAIASAASFAIGAAPPLAVAAVLSPRWAVPAIAVTTLLALGVLGGVGARLGGAPIRAAVVRVVFWGAMAMTVTAAVGRLFGTNVG
jgi:vacuolar iron transporter family protein